MQRLPFKRALTQKVACPFCGMPIERPRELKTHRPAEMPLGSCTCGAVYAYDATGHNLGAAFVEALVFACNMDWDLAWNLLPEEDYLQRIVERYDGATHRIVPGGVYEGRRIAGALYFVRLHQDIREVTAEGVQKQLQKAAPVSPAAGGQRTRTYALTKSEVEDLARKYQVGPLVDAARQDKKIIRYLQRLLYADDKLVRMRAAEILGKVSAVVAEEDPGSIATLLQGLFTSFADSSASSWGAIDAIGEIIGHAPETFAGYIPTLYQFLEDELLRPNALRALGRIAKARPDLLHKTIFRLLPFLYAADPETRGYTAWLLGNLGASEARDSLASIRGGNEEIDIYEEGRITTKTVGQLVAEALEKIG